MANQSKATGTAAESAVVNYLRLNGFPQAERLALSGSNDKGDIRACSSFILEVKAHKTVTDGLLLEWMEQTRREKNNAHADQALLVVKRPYKPVGDWWAWNRPAWDGYWHCTWLHVALRELRGKGYGESL